MIVFHVDERALDLAREIRARAAREIERPPLAVLLIQRVRPLGLPSRRTGFREDLGSRTGCGSTVYTSRMRASGHVLARVRRFVGRERDASGFRELNRSRTDPRRDARPTAPRHAMQRASCVGDPGCRSLPAGGIRRTSFQCQTCTRAGGSSPGARRSARTAFGSRGAMPKNSVAPSSDHCGGRYPATRMLGGNCCQSRIVDLLRRFRRESAPGDHRVARIDERTVDAAAHRGEIVALVRHCKPVYCASPASSERIAPAATLEKLNAVPGFAIDVDSQREQRAVVVPRHSATLPNVSSVAASRSRTITSARASRGAIAAQRDVIAVAAQREV